MNKQEAQADILRSLDFIRSHKESIELHNNNIAKLQAIIDAPEKPGSLLPAFADPAYPMWVNFPVQDAETRVPYISAIETFFELRMQPGSEAPIDGKKQWTCHGVDSLETGLALEMFSNKLPLLVPCFDTRANYQSAIKTIGADRTLQMMRTFQGVK